MKLENVYKLNKRIKNYKVILFLSLFAFITITIWQGNHALNVHENYQEKLMNNVVDKIDREYQSLILEQNNKINEYQSNNKEKLLKIYKKGIAATKEEYLEILKDMRSEIYGLRLFSIVNEKEEGLFKSITGDFLDDCKDEIHDVVKNKKQENLFLHRSSKGVHYDLLLPLIDNKKDLLFVSFKADRIKDLLNKYSLPDQELFLLRNDKIGKIELTNTQEIEETLKSVKMTEKSMNSFNIIKEIKNTRWNIAIRLSEEHKKEILMESIKRSSMLIVIFFGFLIFIYAMILKTSSKLKIAQNIIKHNNKIDPLTGFYNKQEFGKICYNSLKNNPDKKSFILSLKLIATESMDSKKDTEYMDYYLKTISETIDSEDKTYGRIDDILCIFVNSLEEDKIMRLMIDKQKELENMNYLRNVEIKLASLRLCDQFESPVEIINVMKNLNYKKYEEKIILLNSKSEEIKSVFEEQKVIKLLKKSIKNEDIILYKQKIQSVKEDEKEHFEVLVRLKENGKIVMPFKFIPIAEKSGDIIALDKLIIKKSIEGLKEEPTSVSCSINLSGKTLTDKDLKSFISALIKENQIKPSRITFEVTETYAVEHIEIAQSFISWARDLGFLFALDDFGQGVSSFSYLQTLPINKLKIDGSFIKDIQHNEKNRLFVETMIKLSHQLGMTCVAEFVENDEIVEILKELNIDYLQGYGIEKPNEWKKK
jgi:EAL domain-containing protein (putative c-di-GMP-specific phosphodiesterase class I)